MDQVEEQFGPVTQDQKVVLEALSTHITQRISASLARQLREMPRHPELAKAVQQIFRLEELESDRNATKLCD
jgi:hypothetical protein